MSKSILIINHYSGNEIVGMEYRHKILSGYLASDYNVSIISSTFSHLFSSPPDSGKEVYDNNVNQYWVKVPKYNGNGLMRLINMILFTIKVSFNSLRGLYGQPDVVICSTPHPFIVINLVIFRTFFKSKTIFEVRDIWPLMLHEMNQISKFHPLSLIFSILESVGYRFSDAVVSLWSNAKKYTLSKGVKVSNYFFIPNGIDTQEDRIVMESEPTKLVKSLKASGYFVIGYGGSHGLANPMDQVIEAAFLSKQNRKKFAWVMVGDGPNKTESINKTKNLDLDNIFWLDPVSKEKIMGFYSSLDVCFIGLKKLPLFKYGPTPNKLMDYMLASKPIIFSIDSPYNPVRDAKAGLYADPDSGESLYNAAIEISELSQEKRIQMGANGRKYADNNLSYKAIANKYIFLIEKLLT